MILQPVILGKLRTIIADFIHIPGSVGNPTDFLKIMEYPLGLQLVTNSHNFYFPPFQVAYNFFLIYLYAHSPKNYPFPS